MGGAPDLSSNGRSRQGWCDQARHVRYKSARLPGVFLQISLGRRSGSRLSLAMHEMSAKQGSHWNLQSQLLRRSARCASPSRISGKAKAAAKTGRQRDLGRSLRRYSELRTIPHQEWCNCAKIFPPRFKEGTETTIPRANRRPAEKLEVLI